MRTTAIMAAGILIAMSINTILPWWAYPLFMLFAIKDVANLMIKYDYDKFYKHYREE